MKLVLASASPRRSELLRKMGVAFEAHPANVEEEHGSHLSAVELCLLNAARKAEFIGRRFPEAVVLGADTLVFRGSELYGKPSDRTHAFHMLKRLQGKDHQVVTGLCLHRRDQSRTWKFSETTRVYFRRLSDENIQEYIDSIDPLDKAGAYAIQEHGVRIIERIEGSYDNVVGLPTELLREKLKEFDCSKSS